MCTKRFTDHEILLQVAHSCPPSMATSILVRLRKRTLFLDACLPSMNTQKR